MSSISKEKKKLVLLEEPIYKLIPKMAVPTILAQLMSTIYNLADTYFVSSLGTNATAAVGVNSSLEQVITLIGTLIGVGACSYISRLLGAKEEKEADSVMSTSFFTAIILGVLIMIIGVLTINNLVYILGATEDCVEYAMQYASYVLYAAPFMIGSYVLNQCLRSEGSATLAMVGMMIGGLLNCILDPIFIFTLDLGVMGASMATAISKFVSFCILLYPYIVKRSIISISIRKIRFTKKAVSQVLSIGSTSFFRSALGVVAGVLMNHVAGMYSTSVLAGISVANRVMNFPFAVVLGFGQGFQPVVGFNWGAEKFKRVRESFRFSSIVSLVGSAMIGILLFIFREPVIQLFTTTDAQMLKIGALCIGLQCFTLPIHAWVSVINMFYAGIGKARYALLLSTARQGYCFIPILFIVSYLFKENGIASSQALADLLSLAVAIPLAITAMKLTGKVEKESLEVSTIGVTKEEPMSSKKINDIIERINALYPSKDKSNPTDVIKYGDVNKECTGVVVLGRATPDVIKKTSELGANLVIVHEPLFNNSEDKTELLESDAILNEKEKLLDETGVVVWCK